VQSPYLCLYPACFPHRVAAASQQAEEEHVLALSLTPFWDSNLYLCLYQRVGDVENGMPCMYEGRSPMETLGWHGRCSTSVEPCYYSSMKSFGSVLSQHPANLRAFAPCTRPRNILVYTQIRIFSGRSPVSVNASRRCKRSGAAVTCISSRFYIKGIPCTCRSVLF